jgi:hypothetical protein
MNSCEPMPSSSEKAFAELVTRYIDLVYSAATNGNGWRLAETSPKESSPFSQNAANLELHSSFQLASSNNRNQAQHPL